MATIQSNPIVRGSVPLIITNYALPILQGEAYKIAFKDQERDQPLDVEITEVGGLLGRQVLTNFNIKGGSYIDKSVSDNPIQYPSFSCDTAIVTVSQSKNTEITKIQGRNGSVKEYLSNDDFIINVRGSLIGTGAYQYPKDKARALINICQAPTTFEHDMWFLNMFGSFKLYCVSYDVPQEEKNYSKAMFNLDFYSDIPLDLIIRR